MMARNKFGWKGGEIKWPKQTEEQVKRMHLTLENNHVPEGRTGVGDAKEVTRASRELN
jgi:hypothetical protein